MLAFLDTPSTSKGYRNQLEQAVHSSASLLMILSTSDLGNKRLRAQYSQYCHRPLNLALHDESETGEIYPVRPVPVRRLNCTA